MPTPKTLSDLLIGLSVQATKDCNSAVKGQIYKIFLENNSAVGLAIGDKIDSCNCFYSWLLLSPLPVYNPPAHKHKIVKSCTDCGEKLDKI